jgi:hypothetical protein
MTDLSTRTIDRPPPTPAKIARSRREAPSKLATVTATELGEHLGLTRQRVSALADTEHVIERLPNGRFDQDDCRLRYLRWLRDPARRTAKSAAASEFTEAKTRLIELRIWEREGKLIELSESVATIDKICGVLLTHLGSMPAIIGGRDLQLRRRVEQCVFDTRVAISKAASKMADERGEPPEPMEDA